MRVLILTLLVSAAPHAFASTPAPTERAAVSYQIAPGVSVTSFYEHADQATGGFQAPNRAIEVYTPMNVNYSAAPATLNLDANRFYMKQGDKIMTADDFDAWMQQRGHTIPKRTP